MGMYFLLKQMGRGFEKGENNEYYSATGCMYHEGMWVLFLSFAAPSMFNHELVNTFCENSYSFGEHV